MITAVDFASMSVEEIDSLSSVDVVDVKPTVQKFGFKDVPFRVSIDGKHIWQYNLWRDMLRRCCCEKYKARHPTYIDVGVCDQWLKFSNFFLWLNREVGYGGKPVGMDLDKDILHRGNKVYSPTTCCLVPRKINGLLNSNSRARGEFPFGVSYYGSTGKFRAQLNYEGVPNHIGYYDTPNEAFAVYKVAKEAHIKAVALQHKHLLKPAVFESLMNWEVLP